MSPERVEIVEAHTHTMPPNGAVFQGANFLVTSETVGLASFTTETLQAWNTTTAVELMLSNTLGRLKSHTVHATHVL